MATKGGAKQADDEQPALPFQKQRNAPGADSKRLQPEPKPLTRRGRKKKGRLGRRPSKERALSNKGAGLQLCPARECYAGEIDWEALPPLVTRPVSERGVAEVLRPESERSPIAEGEKVFFSPFVAGVLSGGTVVSVWCCSFLFLFFFSVLRVRLDLLRCWMVGWVRRWRR